MTDTLHQAMRSAHAGLAKDDMNHWGSLHQAAFGFTTLTLLAAWALVIMGHPLLLVVLPMAAAGTAAMWFTRRAYNKAVDSYQQLTDGEVDA